MIYLILFSLLLIFPVKKTLTVVLGYVNKINSKLDKVESKLHLNTGFIKYFFISAANFFKGFGVVYFLDELGFSGYLFYILLFIGIGLCNWSPIELFKHQSNLFLPILGLYTYDYLNLIFIFPLCCIVLSLVFDTIKPSIFFAILIQFFTFYFIGNFELLINNLIVAVIYLIAYHKEIILFFRR